MKLSKSSIPNGWFFKQLSEIGKVVTGSTPSKADKLNYEGTFCWITAQDLKNKYIYDSTVKLSDIGKSKVRIIPSNSVLITCIASIGLNAVTKVDCATNQQINAIIPYKDYNSEYLYYIIDANTDYLKSFAGSGGMLIISKSEFEKIWFPFPPIEEQKRIAEVLSCWDDGIEKLEKVIELKEKQKRGLMQRLLSGKTRIKGFSAPWKQARLGEVGTFSKGASIEKSDLVETGIPCVRYGEIYTTHDFYIKEFNSFISKNIADRSTRIKEGDLLFACSGETAEEIGKVIANTNSSDAYAGGDIIILTPNNKRIFSLFLSYYINVVKRKALNKLGQGYSVVHIYAKDLSRLQICYPSLREQAVIAEVLTSADNEISLLKRKCEFFKQQKKWLMQQLLTGKKRLV